MKKVLILVVLIGGLAAFFVLGGQHYLSFSGLSQYRSQLIAYTHQHYLLSLLGFMMLYIVAVAFSIPGASYLTIFAGFLFGIGIGTVAVVVSATLGAILLFLAARTLFRDLFQKKAGSLIAKFELGLKEDAVSYLLILRLVPLFPFWLVNIVPAFFAIRVRTYALTTFFGIIPGSLVYVSVGNGLGTLFAQGKQPDLGIIFKPAILGPILGLALLACIPIIYKRWQRKHEG